MRRIELILDELDWDVIQNEMARSQACRDEDGPILPDGESNLPGAILAEAIRSLNEYRSMYDAERGHQ